MKQIVALLSCLILLSCLMSLHSCQKEVKTELDAAEILQSGKWKPSAIKERVRSRSLDTTYADVTKLRSFKCTLDNYFTFGENRKGIYYAGDSLCIVNENPSDPFNWEVVDFNKQLNIEGLEHAFASEYVRATISNLTQNSMTLQYTIYMPDSTNKRYTYDTLDFTTQFARF